MSMVEDVWIGDSHCALVLRAGYRGDGIEFFTRDEDTLQLGYMRREKGYLIQPHVHRPARREIDYTNEVLVVRSGRVKVKFYDDDQVLSKEIELNTGDIILLMQSGHGFEMLEDSEMVEIKQGPYVGEADKLRF
jgi:mannose-6-phosphate isomerase-like protein (cupin superfamily)